MKRIILIVLICLALAACDLPTTPTEPGPGPETPTATLSPSPSATITFTPTATATQAGPTKEPTATPEPVYTERVDNGNFEEGFDNSFPTEGVYYGVADYWGIAVWRGFPLPRPCEEGQTVGCNPPWMSDRVPEFKPSNNPGAGDPFRTLYGNGQQFFCAEQHCYAAITQEISTSAGEVCHFTTWAQTWGAAGGRSNVSNTLYRSDYLTQDDQDNMHVVLVVNPAGDGITFPFPENYFVRDFGFDDGIYDEPGGGAIVGFDFVAEGDTTTIALVGYQLWPAIANWYFDNVSVMCAGEAPAPVVDLTATPTPIATQKPIIDEDGVTYNVEAQGIEEEKMPWLAAILGALSVALYPIYRLVNNKENLMEIVKDALEKAGKTLEKVGTVLVDRRAMVFAFVAAVLLAGSYLGLDQALSDQITAALQDTYSASVAVIAAVAVLLLALGKILALVASGIALIQSWEKRPPSGLNFKAIAPPKA